jgi:group II intron reverse transcriptase/maturase
MIRKDSAPGVDGVDYREYATDLEANIHDLVERLKRKRYRAKLVKRRYIPKPNGKLRPLGIPATEDKLLQMAVARILSAIYEEDFSDCSYGYRPHRGPLDAVGALTSAMQSGKYCWVVEADIKSYFDTIDHDWLMKMLEERIDDKPFLRLIRKWLKAGILETEGQVVHPATGTPQGGIVSPVLANIYLHYVLDLWFEKSFTRSCEGRTMIIRFADDFVCAFQYGHDAALFFEALSGRLGEFGLGVAPEKTRIFRFCKFNRADSEAFSFLGFEFRWGTDRKGRPLVQRRTCPKKLRASEASFAAWLRSNRHLPFRDFRRKLQSKLRGYWNYYGVRGNYPSLRRFHRHVEGLLFKWLNRRSDRRSFTWAEFPVVRARFALPRPCIVEGRYPTQQRLL